MNNNQLINELKKRSSNLQELSFLDCKTIINDFTYFWDELPKELSKLSSSEIVDNYYEINEYLIKYFLEFVKMFSKEILNLSIEYDIDELTAINGCSAYNPITNEILVSVLGIIAQLNNNISYLQPLFHELRHKMQHDYYKESDFLKLLSYPSSFLLITKHYLYTKQFKDSSFYLNNYEKLYQELDAEEYSVKLLEHILIMIFNNQSQAIQEEYLDYFSTLQQEIIEDLAEIKKILKNKDRIENISSKELSQDTPITSTFINEDDSLISIDKYLKKHPEFTNTYPILKLLWSNQNPKSYQEIIEDRAYLLQNTPLEQITIVGTTSQTTTTSQIIKLYDYIIKSDPLLQLSEYLHNNDYHNIIIFFNNHPTLITNYKKEIVELFTTYNHLEILDEILEQPKIMQKK